MLQLSGVRYRALGFECEVWGSGMREEGSGFRVVIFLCWVLGSLRTQDPCWRPIFPRLFAGVASSAGLHHIIIVICGVHNLIFREV